MTPAPETRPAHLTPANGEQYLAHYLIENPELDYPDGWSDHAMKAAFDAGIAARDEQMRQALKGLLKPVPDINSTYASDMAMGEAAQIDSCNARIRAAAAALGLG